jgi:hypothetical protein
MPRRARHLIPTQLPRRGEVIASCTILLLLMHLLLAQLTLVFAVAFIGVSKASRWRLWWLAVPALAGLAWTLAIGPRAAAAGFTAGPAQLLAYLSQSGQSLSHLLHPRGAFADAGNWLPRQAPLALVAASAEAALAGWLDWVHTNEWEVASPRPGALAAVRGALNGRAISAGGVLTRDGCCLGVARATGARVALNWQETAGGVLVTGAATEIVTVTSLQIVHAALRRRMPVIALDMSGSAAAGRALAAACAATGTPLRAFGPADFRHEGSTSDGCYEPFRHVGPEQRLAMTLALLGMDGAGDRSADGARTYLRTVFEMIEAVPADPRTAVLDDVTHLLNPQALQARFALVPGADRRRNQLAHLAAASARIAQEDPNALLSTVRQLAAVRRSAAGRWLCPGSEEIDLARVVRERSAAFFSVEDPALARLICADIAAVGEDLCRIGVDGDGLAWLCGCESLPSGSLARLVAGGATAGLPVLLTSASPAAADLAATMNVVIMHRLADEAAAASLATRTGTRLLPGTTATGQQFVPRPAVPAQALLSLAPAQFVLAVNSPRKRLVRAGQAVPARLPRGDQLVSADGKARQDSADRTDRLLSAAEEDLLLSAGAEARPLTAHRKDPLVSTNKKEEP